MKREPSSSFSTVGFQVLCWGLCASLLPFSAFADGQGSSPGSQNDPLERHLFPPELIMKHQSGIVLGEDQKRGIVEEVQRLQTDIVPLQFELSEAAEGLVRIVAAAEVDEAAALAQAERIMSLEGQVKARHLTLLIRLKNLLTAEQQRKLQALR